MSAAKPNIIMVYQTHPFKEGQGGGVRYVNVLSEALKPHCQKILFLGVGEKPEFSGNIDFIPITTTHTSYPVFLFKLILWLGKNKVDGFNIVHAHRLYFLIPFLLFKSNLKFLCTMHGRTFSVFDARFGSFLMKLVKPIFVAIEKFSLKKADIIVPVSRDVVRVFTERYPEIMQEKRVEVIGSMWQGELAAPTESSCLQDEFGEINQFILFIGRMEDVKDLPFLFRLFAKHFDRSAIVKLVLAGRGTLSDQMQAYADEICSMNKPIFLGEVSPADIPVILSSASLMVLCSKHEASPTVIKEALACGTPVITSPVGDVDEFILTGRNGEIVEKDEDLFAAKIKEYLAMRLDRQEVFKISKHKLEKARPEAVAKRYADLYRELL